MGNNNYFSEQELKFEISPETKSISNNLKNLYIDQDSLLENDNDNVEKKKIIILRALNQINRNQLITKSDEICYNQKNINNNVFIPINYEIIPDKIINHMLFSWWS